MAIKKNSKKKVVSFTDDDAQKMFDLLVSQLDVNPPKHRTCIRKKTV